MNFLNIQLTLAYDGTHFLGWQKTPMGSSIEGTLQGVLETIFQHPIRLQAASRTDAGVHAHGQVVNFFTEKKNVNFKRLHLSLNQLLPSSIVILEIQEKELSFHPTLDCIEKEYHYHVCSGFIQMPEHRHYEWHCPRLHFFDEMQESTNFFVGKKDFSSLCNVRKQQHYTSYEREVFEVKIENIANQRLIFKIRGQNFLYKMVRNIVGTLVYVGIGKLKKEQISSILRGHDRTLAGVTAPAHGLFLHRVTYSFAQSHEAEKQ